jgi:Mrp family chromosome partitioning ATPase
VTTPSKVAMGAVSKLLTMLIELKKPVLGVIENMTMTESSFIEHEVQRLQVRYLGKIHFDQTLEESIGNPDALSETQVMNDLSVILQKIKL